MRLGQAKPALASRRHLSVLSVLLILVIPIAWVGVNQERRQLLVSRISAFVRGGQNVPTLVVDMRYLDYSTLLNQREKALHAGGYISPGQDFVPAVARLEGEQIPVEIRLMEGPAQRLSDDDKWSYEVRTQEDQTLLGVRQFHLMDPAANHWLDQWAFAQVLQHENILVGRYQFVRLFWNGDDRGIYALQETASQELLKAQGRSGTVIVQSDADLLWKSLAHLNQTLADYDDPVSDLRAFDLRTFEIDTGDDQSIPADPEHAAQRERAIELLRSLQTGERDAAEVLDVDSYARYLALVDLWGALDGLALTHLKFYYSPTTDRLEPISFSANALGSEARLSLAVTYADERLQETYVREVTRISQPEYLERLRKDLEAEWKHQVRRLGRQARDVSPPWEILRQRQAHMRRSLVPVKPVFAYQVIPSSASPSPIAYDALQVEVANVLNLPLEIVGFDIDGATFLEVDPGWINASEADWVIARPDGLVLRALDPMRDSVVRYVRFDIPLTAIHRLDREIDFNREPELYVVTRVLGRSDAQRTRVDHDRSSPPTEAAQ